MLNCREWRSRRRDYLSTSDFCCSWQRTSPGQEPWVTAHTLSLPSQSEVALGLLTKQTPFRPSRWSLPWVPLSVHRPASTTGFGPSGVSWLLGGPPSPRSQVHPPYRCMQASRGPDFELRFSIYVGDSCRCFKCTGNFSEILFRGTLGGS